MRRRLSVCLWVVGGLAAAAHPVRAAEALSRSGVVLLQNSTVLEQRVVNIDTMAEYIRAVESAAREAVQASPSKRAVAGFIVVAVRPQQKSRVWLDFDAPLNFQTSWQIVAKVAAISPFEARNGPVVLSVARMYPRKRLADLLHAAAILRARVDGIQVRIVGRGPEWDALTRLHAELGLGDAVALLGDLTRERLAEEYVNASVFCLPSVQEGFGIVFLEAMAAELPVVACRIAAVPEVVLHDTTGLLVAPRDPGALAATIERLIGEPALAKRLGQEGRRRALGFSPRAVAERFLSAVHSTQDRLGQRARGG